MPTTISVPYAIGMRFTHLRTLIAVLDEGSFTKAARSLGITQPAVSQHVRALELELGVSLFRRDGRRLVPTGAARAMGERGRAVMTAWASAMALVEELRPGGRERLTIGASTTPGVYVVPAVLTSFAQSHPHVDIELEISESVEILRRLRNGSLSVAIVGESGDEEGLILSQFQRDFLIPIWSPRSRLSGLEHVTLEDLVAEPYVSFVAGDGTRIVLERWLMERGLEIEPVLVVDSSEAIKQSVAADLGFSVISEVAVQLELEADLLQTGDVEGFPISREIYVAIRRSADIGPAATALLELLLGSDRAGATRDTTTLTASPDPD